MNQQTLANDVTVSGVGLHTGKMVNVKILPAVVNHGIKFKRIDIENEPIINAEVAKVVSTNRGTTIKQGVAQVSTIEHLLSALVGCQIDNVLVEIDGPEIPILDGSSIQFVNAINAVGIVDQGEAAHVFEVEESITFVDEVTGSEYVAIPANQYEVTAMIDFKTTVLGQQYAQFTESDNYSKEIAPNRTFVFLHELEYLLDQGLIKGGDLNNAVVLVDKVMSEEALQKLAIKMDRDVVKVDKQGVLNTTDLHFSNEPARHKLLDVMGDLALLGCRIKGNIVAKKPGHTSNVEFAKVLKKHWLKQRKLKGKPKYDPTKAPLLDTLDIMKMLPHRYPFLLVDKIIEIGANHVVGVKNVTMNENFFQGHFPGNPVMPGVLQIEAMAQTGGILALSKLEDPHNWDTYFVKINNVKYRQKVVPGDTIIFKLELMSPIRRGLVQMWGTAYVGDSIVSEGELLAQIVRNRDDKEASI